MAINVLADSRLSFSAAARHAGVSLPTIWRWALRGVRGAVLESACLGGKRYTSLEALEHFAAATTSAALGTPPPASRTTAQRQRDIAAAERDLAAAGI